MKYVCTSKKLSSIKYGDIVNIEHCSKGSGFIINGKYKVSLYDVEDFFCPIEYALAKEILSSL